MHTLILRDIASDPSASIPPQATPNIRPTLVEDIDIILPDLAPRTLREIDLYLADVPKRHRLSEVRGHVDDAVANARADTFCAGEMPVGIITHAPEHDYFYTTALPTEAYFSKAFLRLSADSTTPWSGGSERNCAPTAARTRPRRLRGSA